MTSERYILNEAVARANGWVVKNIREYRNSVLPMSLIQCPDDVRIGELLLTCIIKHPVRIRKTDGGWICEEDG